MPTWRGSARRLRASVDVVMHGTGGLTGELERRSAALDGQVVQLSGQVDTLQTITAWLDEVKREVAGLAGPAGRLVAAGSPWWSLLPFTTHRIQLAADVFTADTGVRPDIDVRTRIVLDATGGLAGKRVIDIGCLEGGFSAEFARHGAAEVIGVEARQLSVRRCELVRDLLGLTNLRFVCGDVLHELSRAQEPFDVVLATGILYHLAHPDVALQLMRERCCGFVLVCTHVARAEASSHGCSEDIVQYVGANGTYSGRSYSERGLHPTEAAGSDDLWASLSNETSFWPFEEDLERMIQTAGFTSIEKIDAASYEERWQVDQTNRVIYLCRV
jgi:2-polyprenyl-3-methyl-5-hydroxy-6-metoxy-1,4-benzoquinol methylase